MWKKSSYSESQGNCLEWRTSSYSHANGNCVEAAGGVLIRDSQDKGGPVLSFPSAAWARFTAALK